MVNIWLLVSMLYGKIPVADFVKWLLKSAGQPGEKSVSSVPEGSNFLPIMAK